MDPASRKLHYNYCIRNRDTHKTLQDCEKTSSFAASTLEESSGNSTGSGMNSEVSASKGAEVVSSGKQSEK